MSSDSASDPKSNERSNAKTKEGLIERIGCFLPIVLPAIGIPIAWWLIGDWGAFVTAFVMWGIGFHLYHRSTGFRSSAATEHGCFALILVFLVALLIPSVRKIREAADRMKAERDMKQQNDSGPAPKDGQ